MRHLRVLPIAVFAVLASGCSGSSGDGVLMPDVIGQRLDVALSDIERAGISAEVEVIGGGTFGILDESNWLVCEQLPTAGLAVSDPPRLTVDRTCPGDGQAADGTPSSTSGTPDTDTEPTTPSTSAIPSADPEPQEILTVGTSDDFAELLAAADTDNELFTAFADRYEGWLVEFDGHIAIMNNHGDYTTRYDALLLAGDYGSPEVLGPYFQFRDVNYYDFNLVGSNIPDAVGQGDNLRIVARVIGFEPASGLLLLEPVETEVR